MEEQCDEEDAGAKRPKISGSLLDFMRKEMPAAAAVAAPRKPLLTKKTKEQTLKEDNKKREFAEVMAAAGRSRSRACAQMTCPRRR